MLSFGEESLEHRDRRRHVAAGVGNITSVNFTGLCIGSGWLIEG